MSRLNKIVLLKIIVLHTLLILGVFSIVWADNVKVHEPEIDNVIWEASPADPLTCRLSQQIPYFGTVEFIHLAGKPVVLAMHAKRGPIKPGRAQLVSRPPDWYPGPGSRALAIIDVFPGSTPVRLTPQLTRMVLAELERGWVPTLNYMDWDGTGDRIFVTLLPVNFRQGVSKYYDCEKALLPFGFDDVRYTTIYFAPDGVTLNDRARKALSRVVQYMTVDPFIQTATLNGYSDSQGDKKESYELSIERLKAVQNYLFGQGVPYEKIDATAYGERNPAADNTSNQGRALNRRVTIELIKD